MRLVVLLVVALSGCVSLPSFGQPAWIEDPPIHPGMRLYFPFEDEFSQCTAGFLFAAHDAAFLSVSAHCLHANGDLRIGDPVYAAEPYGRQRPIGTVAFDGWSHSTGERSRDFALIQLADRSSIREQTTAAVPHWGGPLGVASLQQAPAGTVVVTYGNATDRHDSNDNPAQGWMTFAGPDDVRVRLERPTIPGDSGGPLLTADGLAIGILHGSETYKARGVAPSIEVFLPLDAALALVQAEGASGVRDVQLVTWPIWRGPGPTVAAANGPPSSALPSLP